MIDQSQINLINLIPTPLKRVGSTGGGEYHGPCPFCGGTDRFIVQPNGKDGPRWFCRQCGKSGDAISFIQEYEGVPFKEACERLHLEAQQPTPRARQQLQPTINAGDLQDYPCFDPAWQAAAEDFVYDCIDRLRDGWHSLAAARYLEARGIDQTNAVAAMLGLNDQDYRATWGSCDVWFPRGITIPWRIDHQYWNVRLRRPNADLGQGGDKYVSPKGCANGLYNADMIAPNMTIIMTEGEFDQMVVDRWLCEHQRSGVRAVSIGSCSGARLLRWVCRLELAKRVIVAFDNDKAGDQAAQYWQAALPRKAVRLRPSKKDITEMWQAGELAGFIGGVV